MKGNEIMGNKELWYMLNLDPDTVDDVNITRRDGKYVFSIVMKRQTYECPECHLSHVNMKANKSKKLVGAQFNNCPSIYMIYFKRLWVRLSTIMFLLLMKRQKLPRLGNCILLRT